MELEMVVRRAGIGRKALATFTQATSMRAERRNMIEQGAALALWRTSKRMVFRQQA